MRFFAENKDGAQLRLLNVMMTIFMFCIWPFVHFIANNTGQYIDYTRVLFYFTVLFLLAAAPVVLLAWTGRRELALRLAVSLGMGIVLFFSYSPLNQLLGSSFPQFLYFFQNDGTIYVLTWLAIIIWFLAALPEMRSGFTIMIVVMLTIPSARIVWAAATTDVTTMRPIQEKSVGAQEAGQGRLTSNVYFILIDGYGRADQLQKLTGHDNAPFLGEMKARGFYSGDQSRSNFVTTSVSLANTFAMKYIHNESSHVKDDNQLVLFLLANNPVVDGFKKRGRRFFRALSGRWGDDYCYPSIDKCLVKSVYLSDFEWTFFRNTPVISKLRQYYPVELSQLNKGATVELPDLQQWLSTLNTDRFYLFAHNLALHDRLYDAQCRFREDAAGSAVNPLEKNVKPLEEKKREYVESLKCINRQLIELTDSIIKKDPDAIIVIQGDHGSEFIWAGEEQKPLMEWSREAFEERTAILNLARFPAQCRDSLYPTMSSINTFPLIFACIDGKKPDLLEDLTFVHKLPSDGGEVLLRREFQ